MGATATAAHKSCLKPPFSRDVALHSSDVVLPLAARDTDLLLDPSDSVRLYLQWDLQTPRIGSVQQYLWLAGLPRLARTLHRLRLLLHAIHVTEDPNEHMLWRDQCLFVKPLPEYLLNHDFWVRYILHDEELCRSARGLLLSYAWMVAHRSDLRIASERGLVPSSITYDQWSSFRSETLQNIDQTHLHQISPRWRYGYGKLRFTQLNTVFSVKTTSRAVSQVAQTSVQAMSLFTQTLGSLLVTLAYLNIIPSWVQMALTTEKLNMKRQLPFLPHGSGKISTMFVLFAGLAALAAWLMLFRLQLLPTVRQFEGTETQKPGQSISADFPFESPMHVCAKYQEVWY